MSKKLFPFEPGTIVQWNWMGRTVRGAVKQVYLKPIHKTLRGHLYIRNGSPERPAYLVKSTNGNDVLKSHTELVKSRLLVKAKPYESSKIRI